MTPLARTLRALATLVVPVLLLAGAACGGDPTPAPATPAPTTPSLAATAAPTEAAGEPPAEAVDLTGTIAVSGSSTVFPISEAVAEEFKKANPDVRVNVASTGTGSGFKAVCAGEAQVADASRPVKQGELDTCAANGIELVEIPVAFDALSVVKNQDNDWASCLSVGDLATIFGPESQDTVTSWDQVREGFPDLGLRLYGPTPASGTFDYFTEAVMGESGAHRGDLDLSTEEDPLIAQGVNGTRGGIGYFGLAYLDQYRSLVSPVTIENPETGRCVEPSAETVEDGSYQPLARPIFIYVRSDLLDTQPELEAFVEFYLRNATELVPQVGYVALPQTAYDWALGRVELRATGTVFKDVAPGTPIETVLGRLN